MVVPIMFVISRLTMACRLETRLFAIALGRGWRFLNPMSTAAPMDGENDGGLDWRISEGEGKRTSSRMCVA
uniref:Uncharacterized protein n=1 Tax=Arundo donax TaxID=35708 RepID=A0A0A8YVN3_ARUDO